MSGYTYFDDDEETHTVAHDYIDLIKKKTRGGKVKYDSGDFLALDQHDRKRVVQSLLDYEQGHRILDTLKIRIKNSEMPPENKVELAEMIQPKPIEAPLAVVEEIKAIIAPMVVIEPTPEPVKEMVPDVPAPSKRSVIDRIFNIFGRRG